MPNKIFLPGTDRQIELLTGHLNVTGMNILIIGGGSEDIAMFLKKSGAASVIIIVDNNDSLLTLRLFLGKSTDVKVRMMEYDNTDFLTPNFDLIYAQASISNKMRNKIIKEIKRILKPEGYFCVGEYISLIPEAPEFVKDVWSSSDITPLPLESAEKFYREKNFRVYNEFDLSSTLKEFYITGRNLLEERLGTLTDNEKSYYKKILKQISHESNVYLKLGGDKYMGFRMFILRKGKG